MIRAPALVCAPRGRDAAVAATLLHQAQVESRTYGDLASCVADLGDDVGFAVLTEEATHGVDLRPLAQWVTQQPEWSDFPFIVLTERPGAPERNPQARRLLAVLGNVTFLERPFHPTTFVSVVRTALIGRQRQYEARARIAELRRLNETLEERVAERTRELESAHRRTLAEIAQRQRAEEQLRQSQKMELVGQLTGGVAHDFNNLLMAVIGNLDLLRKHLEDPQRARRYIEGAVLGAQRGAALTQRLLAFARRQDLRVEARSLTELVGGMTALLERSVGPTVELRFELAPGLPPALIDANQIELGLLNLAINSRDAMPEGGLLTIAVDRARSEGAGDLAPGDYLRLRVSDSGHGMDAATLKRATEPFFSTKELGKGTGLGLSMIQGLAVQLNGALRLSSRPGAGTVAELWLPAAANAAPVQPAAAAAPDTPPAPRITILLVDDDALIAMSAADMLEDLGHEVLQAPSGAEALEILRGGRRIDLLLTDYAMPKMTGAQLAKAARALRPGLPILLVTGYAELQPRPASSCRAWASPTSRSSSPPPSPRSCAPGRGRRTAPWPPPRAARASPPGASPAAVPAPLGSAPPRPPARRPAAARPRRRLDCPAPAANRAWSAPAAPGRRPGGRRRGRPRRSDVRPGRSRARQWRGRAPAPPG